MTLNEINKAVAKIREIKRDDEAAHSLEDQLRENFIRHVARCGDKNLREMAEAVLKTGEIDFHRWCA